MTDKPMIKLLVGGQNAGKSTWVNKHYDVVKGKPDLGRHFVERGGMEWVVLSRDRVRELYAEQKGLVYQETFAPEHNQSVNTRFFHLLDACLSERDNIMIDNTNMTKEDRAQILEHVENCSTDYFKEALVFKVPVEEAIKRNAARDAKWQAQGKPERAIPEAIIRGTYDKFEMPTKAEGFDMIREAHQKGAAAASAANGKAR